MTFPWWDHVPADAAITQGDMLANCPILVWDAKGRANIGTTTCIVMTQACDLLNRKTAFVTLCPASTVESWKEQWAAKQVPSSASSMGKAFRHEVEAVRRCEVVQSSMLDSDGDGLGYFVDLYGVSSLPVFFLNSWIKEQEGERLRLLPPYREHLSQAFARVYMRVALPIDIVALSSEHASHLFST
jgi:hypothetical protein